MSTMAATMLALKQVHALIAMETVILTLNVREILFATRKKMPAMLFHLVVEANTLTTRGTIAFLPSTIDAREDSVTVMGLDSCFMFMSLFS